MLKRLTIIAGFVFTFLSVAKADIQGPTGSFINNSISSQPRSALNISSGTFRNILMIPHGSSATATDCDSASERGRLFIDTDAPTGQQLYACEGTSGWKLQGGTGSGSSGAIYTINVADGAGGFQESNCLIYASIIGLSNVLVCDNNFSTGEMGIGLGGLFTSYSADLGTKIQWDAPDVIPSTFHWRFPATPALENQVWGGAAISGGIYQYVNRTIYDNPAKEYVIPTYALAPLEATQDSIAPLNISTGTFFDILPGAFDSAVDECRAWNFSVPNSIDVSSSVIFTLPWMSLSTTTGNVGWYIKQNSGVGIGQNPDSQMQGHYSTFDAVRTSTKTLTFTNFEVTVSSLGWVGGEEVDGVVCRRASNASDTMNGDALLTQFRVRIKNL